MPNFLVLLLWTFAKEETFQENCQKHLKHFAKEEKFPEDILTIYISLYIYNIAFIDILLHCCVPHREFRSGDMASLLLLKIRYTYLVFNIWQIYIIVLQLVFLDIMILGEVSCCSVQYGISRLMWDIPYVVYTVFVLFCTVRYIPSHVGYTVVSAHHIQDCIYPTAFTVPS